MWWCQKKTRGEGWREDREGEGKKKGGEDGKRKKEGSVHCNKFHSTHSHRQAG